MSGYQNPFSGIPILRVNEESVGEDRNEREKRIKKYASKYFLNSDEENQGNFYLNLKIYFSEFLYFV